MVNLTDDKKYSAEGLIKGGNISQVIDDMEDEIPFLFDINFFDDISEIEMRKLARTSAKKGYKHIVE